MQHKKPDDFVLSTGISYSVRDFVEEAFRFVDIDIIWKGKGLNEKGYDSKTKRCLIEIDPKFFRPNEVPYLNGDASKAKKLLKWNYKITFKQLVREMMKNDLKN